MLTQYFFDHLQGKNAEGYTKQQDDGEEAEGWHVITNGDEVREGWQEVKEVGLV